MPKPTPHVGTCTEQMQTSYPLVNCSVSLVLEGCDSVQWRGGGEWLQAWGIAGVPGLLLPRLDAH